MPRWADQDLQGWGRVSRARCAVARPERVREMVSLLGDPVAARAGVLARGGGRSYGDAALNTDGAVLLTERLDRVLGLDADTGVVVAEAGVRIVDLLELMLPRGWVPPVMPGTGFATLGGALANDVHGKNHHRVGSFGQHVVWFDLRTPDGVLRRVHAASGDMLFEATVGGLGLTGIVERLALQLSPAPTNALAVERRRIRDLDEFLAALSQAHARDLHVVGWVDALARGGSLGRGILETANPAPQSVAVPRTRSLRWPIEGPPGLLSPLAVRSFNRWYLSRATSQGRRSLQSVSRFTFPLDAIVGWNRMYGRNGFFQFQCVVPPDRSAIALREMLQRISAAGQASFLAVLKTMGPPGPGLMSFAMPGHTLALDFPNVPGARQLVGQLERLTLENGGRVYLAKDTTLDPSMLRQMYPRIRDFERALGSIDPQRRMRSDLARRLAIATESHA